MGFYSSAPFSDVLLEGETLLLQLAVGVTFGLVTAWMGWKIIETETLKPVRLFFSRLIQQFDLSLPEILFISLCAGIGEEILFRGAIQPVFGVWITAIGFVALHGYLNPGNWRLSLYGIFMTLVIAGMGYMKIEFGLISAIAAHTLIDVFLLFKMSRLELPEGHQLDTEK